MPTITGVSGSTVHGGALTITGTGFGTKPVAAPLVWDDASGDPDMLDLWNGAWPNQSWNITRNEHLARRDPIRGVTPPHSRTGRYICGCHNLDGHGSSGTGGNNVHMWKQFTRPSFPFNVYTSFYHRADHAWTFSATNDNNYKNLTWSAGSSPYVGNQVQIVYPGVVTTDPAAPNFISAADTVGKWLVYTAIGATMLPAGGYYGSVNDCHNPMTGWCKYEVLWTSSGASNGAVRIYENGRQVFSKSNSQTDNDPSTTRIMAIGGYARANNQPNNFRYYTDCYQDLTFARVLLGNSSTLDNTCTVREVQVCGTWSDTGITIPSFNRGVIDDGDGGYLFVVDGTNVASAGFEIGDAPDPPDPPDPPLANLVSARIVSARIPAIAGVRF